MNDDKSSLDAIHVIITHILPRHFSHAIVNGRPTQRDTNTEVNRGIRHFRIVFLDILKQLIKLTCFGC